MSYPDHEVPGLPPCICSACASHRAAQRTARTAGRAAADAELADWQRRLDQAMAGSGSNPVNPPDPSDAPVYGVTGPALSSGYPPENLIRVRQVLPGHWAPDPDGTHWLHGTPASASRKACGCPGWMTCSCEPPAPASASRKACGCPGYLPGSGKTLRGAPHPIRDQDEPGDAAAGTVMIPQPALPDCSCLQPQETRWPVHLPGCPARTRLREARLREAHEMERKAKAAEAEADEPADPVDAWWQEMRQLGRGLTYTELTARYPDQPAGLCVTCRLMPARPGHANCADCALLPDDFMISPAKVPAAVTLEPASAKIARKALPAWVTSTLLMLVAGIVLLTISVHVWGALALPALALLFAAAISSQRGGRRR